MQEKQQGNGCNACRSTRAIVVTLLIVCSLAESAHVEEGRAETAPGGAAQVPSVTAGESRSYQALLRWLEQYRSAEPAFQPGQHLTAKDQEALKPFLPAPLWEYYVYPDMEMEIAPTGVYPTPKEWGEKVDTDFELKEDGSLLGFAGGGFPFPDIKIEDPQAGAKIIWNMLWRPGAYDYVMPHVTWSRSPGGKLDREFQVVATSVEFAKGDFCLVPGQEEVRGKTLGEFRTPRDMAGSKNLQINFLDPYKEENGWLYLPAQRKPRRVLSSERTGESGLLADSIREDSALDFGGRVYQHTWRLLGKKKVLAAVNVPTHPEAGGPHLWVPHKTRWEVRDAYVIEQTPKAEGHPYSHKWLFIDAQTFWRLWFVAYDRQEQLLRVGQDLLKYSESYATEEALQAPYLWQDYSANLGQYVFLHIANVFIHAQKPHGTYQHCYTVRKTFSPGRAKQVFSLRSMTSGRR